MRPDSHSQPARGEQLVLVAQGDPLVVGRETFGDGGVGGTHRPPVSEDGSGSEEEGRSRS